MKHIIIGSAFLVISITGISVRELATNKFTPIGGVMNPIARLTIIMTPKCIGLIPILCTIGIKIGVNINIAGVVSITIPTTNNTKLITNNSIILFVKLTEIHSLTSCGTCINVNTLEKATDAARINKIGA